MSALYELDILLFINNKILVPSLRCEILRLIHEGHQDVEKCKGLARQCHRPFTDVKLYCLVTWSQGCEQLDQSRYAAAPRPGVEPVIT